MTSRWQRVSLWRSSWRLVLLFWWFFVRCKRKRCQGLQVCLGFAYRGGIRVVFLRTTEFVFFGPRISSHAHFRTTECARLNARVVTFSSRSHKKCINKPTQQVKRFRESISGTSESHLVVPHLSHQRKQSQPYKTSSL